MNNAPVKVIKENKIAFISLARPETYNALNEALLSELNILLEEVKNDPEVRVIILQGEGKGFSSGQDLKMIIGQDDLKASEIINDYYKPVIKALTDMPKPVICKLSGMAVGAGMALVLACDFIFAAESAFLIPGFVKIGLMPDSGISYFLIRQVGLKKTFELLALGEKVSSQDALHMGLVNVIAEDEKLDLQVLEFAEKLAQGPPFVLSSLKKLLHKAANASLEEVIKLEADFQDSAASTNDFKEGVKAFLEKRSPVFKGN